MPTPHAMTKPHDPSECMPCAAEGHWECQNSECHQAAWLQWQRDSSAEEIAAIEALAASGGPDRRSRDGVYRTSVFACEEHALPPEKAALSHHGECQAPDVAFCACQSD